MSLIISKNTLDTVIDLVESEIYSIENEDFNGRSEGQYLSFERHKKVQVEELTNVIDELKSIDELLYPEGE